MVHLVYCDNKECVLQKILNKTKTMIIRGAAGRKIPHSRVNAGEKIFFIEKGTKDIYVTAIVKEVKNYVKLTDTEIDNIINNNQNKLNLSENQKIRWHKKCLCLIEFENVKIIEKLIFDHQNNMDDWLIINKIEDVLLGSSIPYNYNLSKL